MTTLNVMQWLQPIHQTYTPEDLKRNEKLIEKIAPNKFQKLHCFRILNSKVKGSSPVIRQVRHG